MVFPRRPIIARLGHFVNPPERTKVEHIRRAGVLEVVRKPFEVEHLAAVLRRALR